MCRVLAGKVSGGRNIFPLPRRSAPFRSRLGERQSLAERDQSPQASRPVGGRGPVRGSLYRTRLRTTHPHFRSDDRANIGERKGEKNGSGLALVK